MKKLYCLLLILLTWGCKKNDPDIVDGFVGTWVRTQTLNDATFKGDGKTLITIKKTSETSANVDYSYRFSGTYGSSPATQTSDGSMGLFNVEGSQLATANGLYTIKTVLTYQRGGSPTVVTADNPYAYSKITLSISNKGELEIAQTPTGGAASITTYQKQ